MINTSSNPLIQFGSTYYSTYTKNLRGLQIVGYITVKGPTRPNITTVNTYRPHFIGIDYYPYMYQVTYK